MQLMLNFAKKTILQSRGFSNIISLSKMVRGICITVRLASCSGRGRGD